VALPAPAHPRFRDPLQAVALQAQVALVHVGGRSLGPQPLLDLPHEVLVPVEELHGQDAPLHVCARTRELADLDALPGEDRDLAEREDQPGPAVARAQRVVDDGLALGDPDGVREDPAHQGLARRAVFPEPPADPVEGRAEARKRLGVLGRDERESTPGTRKVAGLVRGRKGAPARSPVLPDEGGALRLAVLLDQVEEDPEAIDRQPPVEAEIEAGRHVAHRAERVEGPSRPPGLGPVVEGSRS
jgi:hypothetical protein